MFSKHPWLIFWDTTLATRCLVLFFPRTKNSFKKSLGASLVAQWLGVRLPMRGTRVRAPVWEDPTCRRATGPMRHNYWTCTIEPASHNYWARMLQLLKPACLDPVLHNKRSHPSERPAHRNKGWPLLAATRESPCAATKDPMQPKINKLNLKKSL